MLATKPQPFGLLFPAVGLGALAGVVAQNFGGMGWIFAVLVLSAAAVAAFQQTLP